METGTYKGASIGRTGRGDWGHGLHLGLLDNASVEVVAVADEDENGRLQAQSQLQASCAYVDYRQMLDREQPDIVTIGPRWTDCHLAMVLDCIEAGAHVYCEKPMTWNLQDADRIVTAADSADRKIAVAHQAVYLPRVQDLRDQLKEGCIGALEQLRAVGKQDRRSGGEDMIVLGTHLFNLMRFLAGDVEWMSSHVTVERRAFVQRDITEGGEPIGPIAGDSVESFFSFASGVSGFFTSRSEQPNDGHYGLDIIGSEGRIAFRGGSGGEMVRYPHAAFMPHDATRAWRPMEGLPDVPLSDGNTRAIADLVAAIEEDRPPLSSARDARSALEMVLGAYEAQITGARVTFPMANRHHPLLAWKEGYYDG
tara:strand:+ start:455 stop:1555 length:1101 start_codon:yes stop_codon:yes gene_type:complete